MIEDYEYDEKPCGDKHCKSLIFLFDGTWNSAAAGSYRDLTNIFKLGMSIKLMDDNGKPQVIFYSPGPGNRGVIDRGFGGVFAQGLDIIVKEAYVNLCSNYQIGDKIYIFGFSRGAIAARALACIISEVGLLRSRYINNLSKAWDYFVNISNNYRENTSQEDISILTDYCHAEPPEVEFLGMFDAVFGRNFESKNRFSELAFRNRKISPIVKTGIHIISIDDNRLRFLPMLWDGANSNQKIEQIWMPGVHADIGGLGSSSFIGITSYLSMVSKINDSTNLAINHEHVDREKSRLMSLDKISVSDERTSPFMKAMRRAYRKPDLEDCFQYIHPLFNLMINKKVSIRRKRSVYNLANHKNFMDLPQAKFSDEDFIKSAFRNVYGLT